MQMRGRLADKGWLTMHWPEEYGGQDASPVRSAIYNEELAYLRAPGRDIFGVRMLGPTLMIHGTEEQKQAHLPSIARGEVQWCQGYSEPESRLRPGVPEHPRRARWRRVCHQRRQDLDDAGPPLRLDHVPGPHRPGSAPAPGHQLHPGGHEVARNRGASGNQYDRRPRVQSGNIRQRARSQQQPGRRGKPRLVRGGYAVGLRAFRH